MRITLPKSSVIARKFHNTMTKVNGYALPALAIGSVLQPQYAPALGKVAAGLASTQAVTKSLHDFESHYNEQQAQKQHDDEKNYNNKFR